jgi:hypothetical protein
LAKIETTTMKTKFTLLIVFLTASLITAAQDKKEDDKKFNLKISGFVRGEAMFDTRQTINSREQGLVFYPANQLLDKNGNDVNAHPATNQLAMLSRLSFLATGPDAFGAKASAVLEGDFTGPSNLDNNGFRLRHAYVKLKWEKSELLMGQYWHPLDIPEMLPGVVSFNTGAPFRSFSRQAQIRFSHKFGAFNAIAVVASQRDNTSFPIKSTDVASEYLRNSIVPNLHLQLHYAFGDHLCGIGVDYKKITPRLMTDSIIEANESLDAFAAVAFLKLKLKKINVKFSGMWGQNLYEHTMMGGFAVQKIDTLTDHRMYTNYDQLAAWGEVSTTGEKFQAGLFAGYAKNLGSVHNIWGAKYARGNNIAYAYRIAPRLTWKSGNVSIASELEYTVAAYGTENTLGDVTNTKEFANFRVLLAAIYNF